MHLFLKPANEFTGFFLVFYMGPTQLADVA